MGVSVQGDLDTRFSHWRWPPKWSCRSEALRRYEALRRRLRATFREQLDFSLAELLPTAS